jgi:hypothetical protein
MITATAILTETIVVTASLGGNVCQPATWTLVDEDANVLDTGSIVSGGAETIIAPDGTVLRDGLPYGSVLSGGIIDVPSDTCADVTIDINGVPFDTVPSGGSLDIPVIDTGANPVGSQIGTDYVIANNATYINSVQVTDQAAEQDAFIAVELDGNPSGTWNSGTQTWEVTSDPCLDATVENSDVTFTQDIVSGATYVLDDYEFEFQDASGTVIATEIRPAMIPETFNFATGLNFQYNLNINGVFSQVVNVTAGDDINININ